MVHVYVLEYTVYHGTNGIALLVLPSTRVRTRVRTLVWPYVHVYVLLNSTRVRTNKTLSQKRLETQALRCNGDTS